MSGRAFIPLRTRAALCRFRREEDGATLVEYALVISLMVFILLAIIDFGRLAFHYVTAEKFVQQAVRIVAVRPPPPGCNVPDFHVRGPAENAPKFGTSCRAGAGICADPGPQICSPAPGDATSEEIWTFLEIGLPPGATMDDVQLRYEFDSDLGFLGGPYVPVVTVELTGLTFDFVAPLSELAALIIGQVTPETSALGGTIAFPALSASMPGEDLALGEDN